MMALRSLQHLKFQLPLRVVVPTLLRKRTLTILPPTKEFIKDNKEAIRIQADADGLTIPDAAMRKWKQLSAEDRQLYLYWNEMGPPESQTNTAGHEKESVSPAEEKANSQLSPQARSKKYLVGEPRAIDVKLGKGTWQHNGNAMFLLEVLKLQPDYEHCVHGGKGELAWRLIKAVHSWGGRFVAEDEESGRWFEIDNRMAHRKAFKCLYDYSTKSTREQEASRSRLTFELEYNKKEQEYSGPDDETMQEHSYPPLSQTVRRRMLRAWFNFESTHQDENTESQRDAIWRFLSEGEKLKYADDRYSASKRPPIRPNDGSWNFFQKVHSGPGISKKQMSFYWRKLTLDEKQEYSK